MSLDPELGKRVLAHLKEKWGEDATCPMCGGHSWQIVPSNIVLALGESFGELTWGGAGSLPTIAVICGTCGNTILVNMGVAKLLPPEVPSGG